MAKKRVAVLFGGASGDHSLSLKSAYSVLRGLDRSKYDVIPVGITKAGRWLYFPGDCSLIPDGSWENDSDCCSAVLSPDPHHGGLIKILDDDCHSLQKIDVIFPVLNGKYGESGQIQALCKLSGIGYAGSGFSAANVCFDKVLTHLILDKAGVKTANYHCVERVNIDLIDEMFGSIEKRIKYPMFVKPSCGSVSVKAAEAGNREELKAAVKIAFSHHHKVIIEEPIFGRELECAVWGSVYSLNVSAVSENAENFTSVIPADIDESVNAQIREWAKTAFLTLGCKNFAVMKFKLTENGLYCCKASNMPGFTEHNILAKLMAESGYNYSEMLDLFIDSAKEA